jgi:hypothetical protein
MALWVVLVLFIQQVPCSDMSLENGCPNYSFLWFNSVLSGKCQVSTSDYTMISLLYIPSSLLFTTHPVFTATESEILSESFNNLQVKNLLIFKRSLLIDLSHIVSFI